MTFLKRALSSKSPSLSIIFLTGVESVLYHVGGIRLDFILRSWERTISRSLFSHHHLVHNKSRIQWSWHVISTLSLPSSVHRPLPLAITFYPPSRFLSLPHSLSSIFPSLPFLSIDSFDGRNMSHSSSSVTSSAIVSTDRISHVIITQYSS